MGLDLETGDAIDIAGVRAGDEMSVEPYVDWRPGRHLQGRLSHTHRRFDLDAGRLFTADLSELRVIYQFNRRTFVRLITQLTDVTRDPALYADPVEARVEEAFGQLLLSYKLSPQTAVYLGYTSDFLDVDASGLTETGNSVFFKVGYNWQP